MPSSPAPAAVSATYSTCQLSPYLKMILGSSAQGQAPSSLPLLVFGIEDTPSSFSFGFSFCISAFPLVLFKDFQSHQLCHCKADVCSATCPVLPGSSPSISSLLMAVSCCKAASRFGLQPLPQPSLLLPLIRRDNGGILVFSSCGTHHHQPLSCARYAVPGVSAKARLPLCPSSFNLNTNKFSWPWCSSLS